MRSGRSRRRRGSDAIRPMRASCRGDPDGRRSAGGAGGREVAASNRPHARARAGRPAGLWRGQARVPEGRGEGRRVGGVQPRRSLSARGLGAPKDYLEAERWFRKAAEHGVAAAQFNLGVLYAHGLGVSQDYVLAHLWFSLAAAQGEEGAKAALEEAAAIMAPSEIAEAERLANDWKPSTWALRL